MSHSSRTQVAIVGGGPSGLLLGQLLHRCGIDNVVLERRTKDYVLSRIRAGVLEHGMVEMLREAGVGERVGAIAMAHDGTQIANGDETFRIDFKALTGKAVTVYGQTEVTRDLYAAREAACARIDFQTEDVEICDVNGERPSIHYRTGGQSRILNCDFVAGCDGFHGVSRRTIPKSIRTEYERVYPFGWLGILSETPPIDEELIYARSERGFALCSMRNPRLSRYYIQCPSDDRIEDWSDDAFWAELKRRLPREKIESLVTGPSIEKSMAPLRSFVCEPMRWGRLFLCGDAAHIVPPTGAKGLNTAASDVHYLHQGLRQFYETGEREGIELYSKRALARVWKTQRFSWWFSNIMHRFPNQSGFDDKIQMAELDFLKSNLDAQRAMAANYVGLPY